MSYGSKLDKKLKKFVKEYDTYNNLYISRSAILFNFDTFAVKMNGGFIIPVLKANAYGHGLDELVEILQERVVPYVAVDGYFEAIQIREMSKQPVLIMGSIKPSNFHKIKTDNCAFVVQDLESLEAWGKTKKRIKIHLELETGMNRYGLALGELNEFLERLKAYPKIELEGVMSHLADADNPRDNSYNEQQVALFDKAVEQIKIAGFQPKYIHIAQTAGSLKVRSSTANTMRLGIGLYGFNPLSTEDPQFSQLAELRPALTFQSTVMKVFTLHPNESVSYNRTFTVDRESRIGVLPAGYYEGVPRSLSNSGLVQVGDEYAPIVGRVCMNHTMIDITDKNIQLGDVATIFSSNTGNNNSVASIANTKGLFTYELVTKLDASVRRTIVN